MNFWYLSFLGLLIWSFGAYAKPLCSELTPSVSQIQVQQKNKGYQKKDWTQWFKVSKPKAVALVIHGLNMRPGKMENVIEVLKKQKIHVLQVALTGHGGPQQNFNKASRQHWLDDVYNAYCAARKVAQQEQIPVYMVGYSTGATVALDLQLSRPGVSWKKAVYFAPALKMTWYARLVRGLFWWPTFTLASKGHPEFQAHAATPMAAYEALFTSADVVFKNPYVSPADLPTLVIMDPEDELVDFPSVEQFVQKNDLQKWHFLLLNAPNHDKTGAPHHALFHRFFIGEKKWSELSGQLQVFLGE